MLPVRLRKFKSCQMTLKKEARFYSGVWKPERVEPCGTNLSHEAEMTTGLCDFCRHGGQALLGGVPQESPQEVTDRLYRLKRRSQKRVSRE